MICVHLGKKAGSRRCNHLSGGSKAAGLLVNGYWVQGPCPSNLIQVSAIEAGSSNFHYFSPVLLSSMIREGFQRR